MKSCYVTCETYIYEMSYCKTLVIKDEHIIKKKTWKASFVHNSTALVSNERI